ncbi:hypothetical protein [Brevibacillus brevis]|uniref:Nuclear transport factor 2 family protein n=1 Tax=Brevibacillus brevis TaxID=1393 RepID=A0ABY9TBE8_BREBE|nr:hypothetical protein [Brevibacillus brevis]WNC16784.1 hypothetical protein RGB73_10830 [Brevibacillus brevis]
MRFFFAMILFFASVLLGCSTETPVEKAIQVATAGLEARFNVTDPSPTEVITAEQVQKLFDHLRPYYTEKVLDNMRKNREPTVFVDALYKQKAKLSLQNVSLANVTEKNEADAFTFHYTATIHVSYLDGRETKVVQLKGQMDVVQEGDTWKISRDWDDGSLAEVLLD